EAVAAKEEHEKAEKLCQSAREEWLENKTRVQNAKAAIERLQRECLAVYGELPSDQAVRISRKPVADWTTTADPAVADVETMRGEARGVEEARRRFRDAETTAKSHAALEQRERLARETLERLSAGLPADRAGLRKQHTDLEAELQELFKAIDAGR